MIRHTLAQRLRVEVVESTPAPRNPVEEAILMRRLPRNRLEARRLIATKGKIARV